MQLKRRRETIIIIMLKFGHHCLCGHVHVGHDLYCTDTHSSSHLKSRQRKESSLMRGISAEHVLGNDEKKEKMARIDDDVYKKRVPKVLRTCLTDSFHVDDAQGIDTKDKRKRKRVRREKRIKIQSISCISSGKRLMQ